MKTINAFLAFLLLTTVAFGRVPEANKNGKEVKNSVTKMKRYGVKSAVVEYEISGAKTGTEKLIFDDWGAKEVKYENGKIAVSGFTVEDNRMTIIEGDWTYKIDLKSKTGTKIKTPYLDEMKQAAGSEDLTVVGERIMKKMGGKIIGQEVLLGKRCDIWEIESVGTKSWVWEWITLKTEVKFMGNSILVKAVKVDVNTSLPSNTFDIPEGVSISEGSPANSILDMIKNKSKKN